MKYSQPRINTINKRRIGNNYKKYREPFYVSLDWKDFSTRIIRKRGRRCEQCGRIYSEQGKPIRAFVDHIIELKDGGKPFDEQNVQVLCGSCHTTKTMTERSRRATKQYL